MVAGGVGGAARTVGAGHLGVDFQLALLSGSMLPSDSISLFMLHLV